MADQTNGREVEVPEGYSIIVLTLKRDTFQMTIGGKTENYDEALAMLDMAHRDFEARLRAGKAGELLNVSGRLPVNFDPRRRG